MNGRRDFLKQVAMLAAAGGAAGGFPASISRALAIDPVTGSTWLDAEHVVILMQENRVVRSLLWHPSRGARVQ
jgi:phospholipase C